MKNRFLFLLCIGLTCRAVVGEDELIKKTVFPYMAFIYYSDPSVVDAGGARFIRSAVLIRADWLVTGALGPSVSDNNGFPMKTLVARVGAVTIDANFTLNEDEEEQEREIIQIVRPYKHSATQWWTTDISLMKTLLPFNESPAVAAKQIGFKKILSEKTCNILVYAKKSNRTDEKALMQLFVEVLPATMENCGHHFSASSMICASDSAENKDAVYDPKFCQGNSGGPLICEGEVMGLQTYIDNDCKQPHLYQLLSSWDNFITCGIEEKCQEEQCSNICDVTHKDPQEITKKMDVKLVSAQTPTQSQFTLTSATPETVTPVGDIPSTSITTTKKKEIVNTTIAITTRKTPTPTHSPTLTQSSTTTTTTTTTHIWPNIEESQQEGETEDSRIPQVQLRRVRISRGAAEKNMCFVQTVFFGLLLECLL